ncbi:MAG TPA: LuxR C-terminal-related transcriptional regulator [Polyangiaceae bacterium]|jgi:DNA-binding NarL/FixJ family response regulator|nr:LuxR C-terminal-related transcriptional regulator [Polyangiaceae bacterium]
MQDLLEIERQLAGVLELSDLAGSLLSRLQRMMGASGCLLSAFDVPERGAPSVRGGSLAGAIQQYPVDLIADDPLFAWNRTTSPALFLAEGHGLDLDSYRRSRAYLDFYRRYDIGFMCGVRPSGLRYGSLHMFSMMFATPKLSQRFAPTALRKLRHLEVPLRSAARRMARVRSLEHEHDILRQLLERQRGAFVLWDESQRLAWISPRAQQLLGGQLARRDLEHAAALARRQLRQTDTSQRDLLLGRPRTLLSARGRPLLVEFSWLTTPADQRVWLLAELQLRAKTSILLAKLSSSEARVFHLLERGLSNREMAEQLSVSGETVKTHVKHILQKLGVTSRAKAVHLIQQERG